MAWGEAEEDPGGQDEDYGHGYHAPSRITPQPVDDGGYQFKAFVGSFFCGDWLEIDSEELIYDGVDDGQTEEHVHRGVAYLAVAADKFADEIAWPQQ